MAQPALTPDVLASPALALLLDLEQLGCHVEVTPDTIVVEPASKLTAAQQSAVRAYAPELALLLRCCDAGVQVRRDTFARQIAAAPPGTIPAFVLEPAPLYAAGVCFSCGDTLQAFRYGRCWRCALAWRLAAGVPMPLALADALDAARLTA